VTDTLLSVRDLSLEFSVFGRKTRVLEGVSLDVPESRHVALVGESGCGKSVTMRAIMGILRSPPAKITRGEIFFDGHDLLKLGAAQYERLRGTAMSMVFQDPMTSLNPVFTIGDQMGTIVKFADRRLGRSRSKSERMARVYELLELGDTWPEISTKLGQGEDALKRRFYRFRKKFRSNN